MATRARFGARNLPGQQQDFAHKQFNETRAVAYGEDGQYRGAFSTWHELRECFTMGKAAKKEGMREGTHLRRRKFCGKTSGDIYPQIQVKGHRTSPVQGCQERQKNNERNITHRIPEAWGTATSPLALQWLQFLSLVEHAWGVRPKTFYETLVSTALIRKERGGACGGWRVMT